MKRTNIFYRMWKGKIAYLFLLPLFIGLIIFYYYPPVSGVFHSFFEWNGTNQEHFIGIQNYKKLFSDEIFLNSIVTLFKIMIPRCLISVIIPLIMAELVFAVKNKKIQSFYRIAVLLPIVAPGVVGLLIWRNIFDPANGLLTTLVRIFQPVEGVIDWLGNPRLVIFSVIFMGFPWIGGTSVLIYMAGLMNISTEVFEAVRLDGATIWQRIMHIDLPLLDGQIRYFLVFGIISGLQDYGTQLVLTSGGPGYSTMVPGYYMYTQAFTSGNMGYACAIGTILFAAIVILTAMVFRITKKKGTAL